MNRRTFLQRTTSGLLLPLLSPTARAETETAPKRLIVFHYPQGTVMRDFIPSGSINSFTLPYILQPLQPFQDRLTVITGVDNVMPQYNQVSEPHPNANYSFLTGTPFLKQDILQLSPQGPSFEEVIANRISTQCPFKRLDFAVGGAQTSDGILSPTESAYFWHGPNDPICAFNDPLTAVYRVFGDMSMTPTERWIQRSQRSSVLNSLLRDFHTYSQGKTAEDKQIIEAHTHKIEQLLHRIAGNTTACVPPQPLLPHNYSASYDDNITAPLMNEIMVYALQCDYTRVATIHFANSHDHGFEWLLEQNQGSPIVDHELWDNWHAMVHADYQFGMEHVFRWYMEMFADLLGRLSATEDSDGDNLLDHSLILCLSEFSSGRHWHSSLPIVLAGCKPVQGQWLNYLAGNVTDWENAEGQLFSGNTMNQLLLSLINQFGFDDQSFGYMPPEQPQEPLF